MLENLEKMAKEMGLSKSAMISVALENYKKGQVKIKKPSWQAGLLDILYFGLIIPYGKKKKQDTSLSYSIPIQFQKIGK